MVDVGVSEFVCHVVHRELFSSQKLAGKFHLQPDDIISRCHSFLEKKELFEISAAHFCAFCKLLHGKIGVCIVRVKIFESGRKALFVFVCTRAVRVLLRDNFGKTAVDQGFQRGVLLGRIFFKDRARLLKNGGKRTLCVKAQKHRARIDLLDELDIYAINGAFLAVKFNAIGLALRYIKKRSRRGIEYGIAEKIAFAAPNGQK